VVSALLAVRLPTSARFHSHGVTGGVKRETTQTDS
jgi:hypothetical protein